MKHRIFILALIALSLCTTSCTKRALWEADVEYAMREPRFPIADYGQIRLTGCIGLDSRGNIIFSELGSSEKLILTGEERVIYSILQSHEMFTSIKPIDSCCHIVTVTGKYSGTNLLHLDKGLRRFQVLYISL